MVLASELEAEGHAVKAPWIQAYVMLRSAVTKRLGRGYSRPHHPPEMEALDAFWELLPMLAPPSVPRPQSLQSPTDGG